MSDKIQACNKRRCVHQNDNSKTGCLLYDNPSEVRQQIAIKNCEKEIISLDKPYKGLV